MDDKEENHPDPERPRQKVNISSNYKTITYDVKNTGRTD